MEVIALLLTIGGVHSPSRAAAASASSERSNRPPTLGGSGSVRSAVVAGALDPHSGMTASLRSKTPTR
ncbi:MAG TPA: hypothetical protein VLK58_16585, partial [Conexibacter sp.]|nr:hypothetical protein [Conexibacter sp.]